jgi:hypothetical protein
MYPYSVQDTVWKLEFQKIRRYSSGSRSGTLIKNSMPHCFVFVLSFHLLTLRLSYFRISEKSFADAESLNLERGKLLHEAQTELEDLTAR